jgi:hypothetical protein
VNSIPGDIRICPRKMKKMDSKDAENNAYVIADKQRNGADGE